MTEGWVSRVTRLGPPAVLVIIGGTLATATVLFASRSTHVADTVEATIIGILAVAVLASSVTLHASDRGDGEKWRIAGWSVGGTLGASVLASIVLIRSAIRDATTAEPLSLVIVFAGCGALAGLFVGGNQVRAIAAGRSTERQRTSQLLEQRETERLTFLNKLLRHNVLNGMNIVLGYTDALEDGNADRGEYVDRIRTRSEAVVELVENVQVLVRSLSGDLEIEAVDLSDTANDLVERTRRTHDETDFSADLEDGVVVATTPFVASAIENLLTNAAVHNPSDDAEVTVRVERDGDDGIVSVIDNGPGIPADVVDTYFGDQDPKEHFVGDGLGLYLVDELVTTHGGTVDVASSPTGTTITLGFPLTAEAVSARAADDAPG